ncbi:uncharacterized protein LOC119665889 [Teleopsis dalmanni]|uniref:uncharacterized protein LOC119665889 n=1 Tax=Teleopsis dalmanni TaxID=139649 RepID=UPI0018CEC561|nr:uncharacterized protein LOC119665889 [Teleopsis dalmanni]
MDTTLWLHYPCAALRNDVVTIRCGYFAESTLPMTKDTDSYGGDKFDSANPTCNVLTTAKFVWLCSIAAAAVRARQSDFISNLVFSNQFLEGFRLFIIANMARIHIVDLFTDTTEFRNVTTPKSNKINQSMSKQAMQFPGSYISKLKRKETKQQNNATFSIISENKGVSTETSQTIFSTKHPTKASVMPLQKSITITSTIAPAKTARKPNVITLSIMPGTTPTVAPVKLTSLVKKTPTIPIELQIFTVSTGKVKKTANFSILQAPTEIIWILKQNRSLFHGNHLGKFKI